MKLPVYNSGGEKTKDIEVKSNIFDVEISSGVIHQVVVAQQANARQVLAHTKDKSEVRGGGKKPWNQKGTGRARHGSSRSPLWIGGGVTFGPTKNRNFSKQVNQKQKQLALTMCLSDKVKNKLLIVFENLGSENAKTKELKNWVDGLKNKIKELKESKNFLLVVDGSDKKLIRAATNLDNVNTIFADSLNCVEILKYDTILTSEDAIKKISSHYNKISKNKVEKLIDSPVKNDKKPVATKKVEVKKQK